MTAQLNLFAAPDESAVFEVLTREWQSLPAIEERIQLTSTRSAWPWATRLVREYRAQHRVIDGLDHYRLGGVA